MHYFLHPAFEFDGDALGFWAAKYEPTAAEDVLSGTTGCNPLDNVTTKTIKIVPKATSWRCIDISTAYKVSLEMKYKTSVYGWQSNELDSHMMKNTEWGAITYLSKSKYGADTEEVWNNTYNQYRTGCSGSGVNASNESTCIAYQTVNGQKASTTHNIYGIYDMSSGAWERVMGIYNDLAASSGFSNEELLTIENKYITKYNTPKEGLLNGSGMNYDKTVYGDAVYETSNNASRFNETSWIGAGITSWYGDGSFLPYSANSWFNRSGNFSLGSNTGLFNYNTSAGNAHFNNSFRSVLFPQ